MFVKGVVRKGDAVLILRRAEKEDRGLWDLPGGRVETGEHPQYAMGRELHEETGMDVLISVLVETQEVTRHGVGFIFSVFPTTFTVVLSTEHDDYKWASEEEIKALLHPALQPAALAALSR